jgi:hypothetical protein
MSSWSAPCVATVRPHAGTIGQLILSIGRMRRTVEELLRALD